jgi:transposase-like protein
MASRWKNDKPPSLAGFMKQFPDEDACVEYLRQRRWPDGFVCPTCGGTHGWPIQARRMRWECRECGHQTSITAGTVMHGSKIPLLTWFLAAHLLSTHSNGMSALQLQAKLGVGSYKTAWLLLAKLRRSMVNPERTLLEGVVEMDETFIPYRTKHDPVNLVGGRSKIGRIQVIGAVEVHEEEEPTEDGKGVKLRHWLGRIRLDVAPDAGRTAIQAFCTKNLENGTSINTDGFRSYKALPGHQVNVVTRPYMEAHVSLQWIHRVFSNLKTWALGVYHGLRWKHIQTYLNEFVFRWNRRRLFRSAFDTLIGIGVRLKPVTYRQIIA